MDKKVEIKWSLTQWLQAVSILAGLWKGLVAMIEAIEDSNADGAEKKNAVLAWLSALLDGAATYVKEIPALKDFILELADKAIDAIVATYNALGKFVHK